MQPELGIIEGFYGRPWTWPDRVRLINRLQPQGFGFYIYAPKSAKCLRENWREPFTSAEAHELAMFSRHCRDLGVRFGVGLSPLGAIANVDRQTRGALERKLTALDQVGIEDLALLFDDVRNDLPGLAARQADLAHWVRARTGAARLIVCPSYYSDDPMLDTLFGPRPARYLEQLGQLLDGTIDIFWAGKSVCSEDITPGHLQDVTDRLARKPFLWDNYPVNDGPQMSRHLHLRGFRGRSAAIGEHLVAHGINPSLQPALSAIPALTLAALYREGASYNSHSATQQAMVTILGRDLAIQVLEDLPCLQELGLDQSETEKQELRRRYSRYDHPCAREILDWLDGAYQADADTMPTL